MRLNVAATRQLAELCRELACIMIYISTDYVFDGSAPPYGADSPAKPLNKYGETKLAGEEVVLGAGHTVLRIPVLYGGVERPGESAVTALLEAVRSGREVGFALVVSSNIALLRQVGVSSWEVRCPSHTRDIARILLDLLLRCPSPESTIYQWCGMEKISKAQIWMAKVLQ